MQIRLAVLVALPALVWTLATYDLLPRVSLCMFQIITHRPCPGCGMTRAMLLLSRGDVPGSFRMHPLGIALAALYLGTVWGTVVAIARGGDPVARFLERRGVKLTLAMLIAFLGLWIVRAWIVPSWAPAATGYGTAASGG